MIHLVKSEHSNRTWVRTKTNAPFEGTGFGILEWFGVEMWSNLKLTQLLGVLCKFDLYGSRNRVRFAYWVADEQNQQVLAASDQGPAPD